MSRRERSLGRFALLETRGYLLCRCILAKLCATRVLQDNPNPACPESDSSRDMRRQLPFVSLEG